MHRRIDIVGGGISGLATAFFISQKKWPVTIHLWERDPDLGGLAGTFSTHGFEIEKYYHHIFHRDLALLDLIAQLGLADRMVWARADTATYYDGRFYRLATPLDVLRFGPLPLWDRFRMGRMVLRARRIQDWRELDRESARSYVERVAGKNVFRVVWEPLFKGKFGRHSDTISAAWLWSKLVDRGGSRDRSGHESLGYLRGGLGELFRRIRDHLQQQGHVVHHDCAVSKLEVKDARISKIHTTQGIFETQVVIGAAQVADTARMLHGAPAHYIASLEDIEFLGNVCLVLVLKKKLSQYYWTNIADSQAPFVGCIEHTNWLGTGDYNGKHIVYLPCYVESDDPVNTRQEDELVNAYEPYLKTMFPDYSPASIEKAFVWRTPHAQPLTRIGYGDRIPSIITALDNFFVCTMVQIFPHDRQVSNGVELARDTAAAVGHWMEERQK